MSNTSKEEKSQNITVAVRVRPFDAEEKRIRTKNIIHQITHKEIHIRDKKYTFDRAFNENASQLEVYSVLVTPLIPDVLAGYNCTIFAYGQTGSGKTFTIAGNNLDLSKTHWTRDETAGIIPRVVANIFEELSCRRLEEYDVRISLLELYNEEARDLFSDEQPAPPLNIFNDSKGSVFIQNLKEITISNNSEVYKLLEKGVSRRQTSATAMNNRSSRSHAIFTITVHTRELNADGHEILKTGKLNLVDLAGSENAGRSGVKDKQLKELSNINKSLLTLGRVIHLLSERKATSHIPYRDSKLTRILQDSLGGSTKTKMIATISPSQKYCEETLSTLEYAFRVRNIKNTPLVHEKVTRAQMMKEMINEIEKLKRDLEAARRGCGFYVEKGTWEELETQWQSRSESLSLKMQIIEDIKSKIEEVEAIRDMKEKAFTAVMDACKNKGKLIEKMKSHTKNKQLCLRQEEFVARHSFETAQKVTEEAKSLLNVTNKLAHDQDVLRRKLERQYSNNSNNEKATVENIDAINADLIEAKQALAELRGFTANRAVEHEVNSVSAGHRQSMTTLNWDVSTFEAQKTAMESHIASTDKSINEPNVASVVDAIEERLFDSRMAKDKVEKYNSHMENILANMNSLDVSSEIAAIMRRSDEALQGLKYYKQVESEERTKLVTDLTNKNLRPEPKCLDMKLFTKLEEVSEAEKLAIKHHENTFSELYTKYKDFGRKLVHETTDLAETGNEVIKSDCADLNRTLSNNVEMLGTLEEDITDYNKQVNDSIVNVESELKGIEANTKATGASIICTSKAGDTPKREPLHYPKEINECPISRDSVVGKVRLQFVEEMQNESVDLLNLSELNE